MGYLTNFIVYMLAMVGVLMLAVIIFKHSTGFETKSSSGKCLKVIDTLSLGARKNLYIISAGGEKFLIAGDAERTSLISKLNPDSQEILCTANENVEDDKYTVKSFKDVMNIPKRQNFIDKTNLSIKSTQNSSYSSVMKSLAERIK